MCFVPLPTLRKEGVSFYSVGHGPPSTTSLQKLDHSIRDRNVKSFTSCFCLFQSCTDQWLRNPSLLAKGTYSSRRQNRMLCNWLGRNPRWGTLSHCSSQDLYNLHLKCITILHGGGATQINVLFINQLFQGNAIHSISLHLMQTHIDWLKQVQIKGESDLKINCPCPVYSLFCSPIEANWRDICLVLSSFSLTSNLIYKSALS